MNYKSGRKLCYLNSFYCDTKFGKSQNGKFYIARKDFIQMNIKDCDTGETILKYIQEPTIEFYVTKNRNNRYPKMSMPITDLNKVECKYKDRDKVASEHLGILKEYYDACRMGREIDNYGNSIDYKRKFVQEFLNNSPHLYQFDMNVEDFYKNKFMDKNGRDVYNRFGVINHGMMDIEVDQNFKEWNAMEYTAPINSISIVFKYTGEEYLLVLKNQKSKDMDDVIENFDKFVDEYITPHTHTNKIVFKGLFYETEKELLEGFWNLIHIKKPDFVGIWNMNFDIKYILNRMVKLDMDLENTCCHPDVPSEFRIVKYIEDGERRKIGNGTHPSRFWDWVHISGYTQFYDMMALYSLLRKRYLLPSYKLDDISESETGYGKLDYSKYGYDIKHLAHQNFKIFLSYSAIDTLRLLQIEENTDDLNKSMIFCDNTRYEKSQKISHVIKNKMYRIYKDRQPEEVIGNNVSYNIYANVDGAIIASPNNMMKKGIGILNSEGYIYEDVVDFDEASEYPRVILSFNISKNSLRGRFFKLVEKDEDDNIIKCYEGDYVYDFNKHLQTLDSSIFYIGQKYFGLPSVFEIINNIENNNKVCKSNR